MSAGHGGGIVSQYFDEEAELRKAAYRARFLSWRYGRAIASPYGNLSGINPHWIHEPLRWADTGEPVAVAS